jgi:hypothetical protein
MRMQIRIILVPAETCRGRANRNPACAGASQATRTGWQEIVTEAHHSGTCRSQAHGRDAAGPAPRFGITLQWLSILFPDNQPARESEL